MQPHTLSIDPDVRKACGPPLDFYYDRGWFEAQRMHIFRRAWLGVGAVGGAELKALRPLALHDGCLDEPLVLVRDGAVTRCLSNVCTHRAKIVVDDASEGDALYCRYHGRRWRADGTFRSAPEFAGAADFPSPADDLAAAPLRNFGPIGFVSIDPAESFDAWIAPVAARTAHLPLDRLRLDAASVRRYEFDAHWALYCDNYLEGLHIPFLHAGLTQKLDLPSYRYESLPSGTLQIGIAAPGEAAFEPPAGHPEHGLRVAAWYYWLFPGTMLNFYPWGISVNDVQPLGPERTRVTFASYVMREDLRGSGAGTALDRVEMEDEAAVQSVQRGLRSRFARRARYSPAHEAGVHHFHRLLQRALER